MSSTIIEVVAGSTETRAFARRDADGDVLAVSGGEECSASVWRGDDTAPLFAPACFASVATDRILLTFAGADTATLAPGDYPINLTVDGVTRPVGTLRVLPAPGTRQLGLVYATWDDMLAVGGDVLAHLKGRSDQSLGQEALEAARRWTHRTAIGRACDQLAAWHRGHAATPSITAIVDASEAAWTLAGGGPAADEVDVRAQVVRAHLEAGYLMTVGLARTGTATAGTADSITLAAGSSAVAGYYADWTIFTTGGTGPDQRRWITGYDGVTKVATVAPAWDTVPDETTTYRLESGVDDAVSVRRANAMWACFEVFRRQLGEASEGTSFQALAGHYRTEAIRMLAATPLRIDTTGNGRADYTLEP